MRALCLAVAVAAAGCHDAAGKAQPAPAPAATGSAGSAEAGSGSDGSAAVKPPSTDDYVPAEFKSGMSRWKDTGVYLDGKPIAFLTFGELPIALKPIWIKDKVSADKPPGCPIEKCPGWKWSEQRAYKFTEYLRALGIDLHKIKMLHVYGPKLAQTIAVTGAQLLEPKADQFTFHFGADVGGKPIPHEPANFGNHKQPDKINGVMIYIDKQPPTITRDGIELDGIPQNGVPYYGEPLRGGVRIYLDDRYLTMIKRQDLDVKKATTTPDGELHWKLGDLIAATGADTSKLVEGWVLRDDRRTEHIGWPELRELTFTASSKAHGGILLGPKEIVANGLALHTRAIQPAELPVIRPDEEN